jgi:hypothetical protein
MAAKTHDVPGAGPPTSPPLFSDVEAFAARLGLSSRYVHDLMRRGVDPLPSVKLGRRRLIPVGPAEQWAAQLMSKSA